MFDLGWQEFMMVAIVLVLVVGPRDMPRILRSFSQFMRKAKSMAREFTASLEEVANEADVKNIVQDIKSGEFDDVANLIDDGLSGAVKDVKDAAGVDGLQKDIENIKDDRLSEGKVSAKKATPKPASKKKAAPKKKSASKKKAASTKAKK